MLQGRSNRDRSRGQNLVEFALVIPLFLLMLFGMIDIGRVIWANDALANAAREGARYASVNGDNKLMVNGVATTPATKQDIRDKTTQFAIAGGTNVVVTVCYSAVNISVAQRTNGCSGDVDQTGATNRRGALVTVSVTSTVPILTGSLLGMGNFTVSGTSTVLVNN
jgi:Flp pilus assembly protein TadG